MRPLSPRVKRRLVIAAAVVAAVAGLVALGLLVLYPRVGAWFVRARVVPRLEAKLGRHISIGDIEIELGHAVLRDVVVAGPLDGPAPLARFERIDIDFDTWSSLWARADVERMAVRGGEIAIHRHPDGTTNVLDLEDRLGGGGGAGRRGRSLGRLRPDRTTLTGVRVRVVDEFDDTRVTADELAATADDRRTVVAVTRLRVAAGWGPAASAERLVVTRAGGARDVVISGGAITPWTGLALTGIGGTIRDAPEPGRLAVALEGGYGGVAETLWTARGWFEAGGDRGHLQLGAARFSLDRLRPILEHSSLLHYQDTTVDAELTVDVDRDLVGFKGGFHLHNLTVGHPMLAEKPVPNLDVAGDVAGSFDRRSRVLALTRGDFASRQLPVQLTGTLALPGGVTAAGGRRARPAVTARLVIPPVPCQQALEAIPPQMASYLQGYELRGTFSTDLSVAIDYADLEQTQLDGSVAIRRCRITRTPDDIKRLEGSFEHYVEVEKDKWLAFVIGPENPDFVPIAEVSPNLLNSLMTTEDSAFYQHRGFITREFKSALIKNLQAGYFKYGASSITMQTVKNVLLYREKTLSRKLQELFLTWSIEQLLDKDRIFEIYVNAIEYGPGLYGIGPAARHYFGKRAADLTPKEAAFFSSILPSPKARYRQYCNGTLTRWTEGKIDRILALMVKRGRLTQEQYDAAVLEPLVFVKDGTETEDECNKRVSRALKHARSTNPQKK